jgi:glutathione-regulated potassium-efflux system ancillary protein KefC
MGEGGILATALIYLAAAVVSAAIAKRLGLGSVLGYLIAGVAIGPHALGLVSDSEEVLHVAEFGVVIMLFLIGLELQPKRLWQMRTSIIGMGGAQVLATGVIFCAIGVAIFGLAWQVALAIGFALAQSSTAIVLQSLRERGLVQTDAGQGSFSILLFQDMSIIPKLALFPLLATLAPMGDAPHAAGPFAALPGWGQALAAAAAIGLVILAGKLALRPAFRWIAATGLHEIFTAFALALVVGVALLMQAVGLSPALGAFLAGVLLADSEFRHEIESDIDPFRGLLLGLFFISVGAGIDLPRVIREPALILGVALGAIVVKAAILFAVARAFGRRPGDAAFIALAIAETGEFALVLFAFSAAGGIIPPDLAALLNAAVVVSMMLTPLLVIGADAAARALGRSGAPERPPEIEEGRPDVIVAGYGRFGQAVGRLLSAQGFKVSVLEHDADQVELLRGFGRKVNFGDATRLDLLRLAGAGEARLLVIALDDRDKTTELVDTARRAFPHLKIAARAYDRRHAYELMARNVEALERETFAAGVKLGVKALRLLGKPAYKAERAGMIFARYDQRILDEMFHHWRREEFAAYQRLVRDRTALEEQLIREDIAAASRATSEGGWDEEPELRADYERKAPPRAAE